MAHLVSRQETRRRVGIDEGRKKIQFLLYGLSSLTFNPSSSLPLQFWGFLNGSGSAI